MPNSILPDKTVFTITFVGDINDKCVIDLINTINSLNPLPDELIINISSGGGSIISGITAYNFLKQLQCTLHTHNLGEVSSAAFLPFLAGAVRTADEVSIFMFHPMSVNLDGQIPYPKLQEVLSMLEQDIHNYASIVAKEVPILCEQHDITDVLKHETLVLSPRMAFECGLLSCCNDGIV